MESWKALKFLSEGEYIRRKCWEEHDYIKLNTKGIIVDKYGYICPIQFTVLHEDWEIYIK